MGAGGTSPRKRRAAVEQSSAKAPIAPALLGGSEGEGTSTSRTKPIHKPKPRPTPFANRWFAFPPLCRAEQLGGLAGFTEDCSTAARLLRGLVPQAPRDRQAAQEKSGIRVPFSLVPFSWANKRKEPAAGQPPASNSCCRGHREADCGQGPLGRGSGFG